MLDRWRQEMLGRWAVWVCAHPWWILAPALALAAAAVGVTVTQLRFQSDRNDLISRELEWNRRYIEYRDKLAGRDRIVVIVEIPSGQDGIPQAERFVDQLHKALEEEPHVERVWWRLEASPILSRLLPLDEYAAQMEQIAQSGPLLTSESIGQFLGALAAQLRKGESEAEPDERRHVAEIDQLRITIQALGEVAAGQAPDQALERAGLAPAGPYEYITTPDGRYMVVDVEVRPLEGEVDPFAPGVAAVREILEHLREEAGIRAGLTGLPVVEADETLVSMRDSTRASIIAVTAIAALLIFAFHGWMLPLLSVAILLLAVAWSFGFLSLAIGHLQVLSVVFTVILMGLGIDFAIHFISRFELVRHNFSDNVAGFCAALDDAMRTTGPGIITGALTTAIAFSTTLLTDFQGMAEMGLIAGVGVVLCMIAMLSVLPALMRLLRPHTRHIVPTEQRGIDLHEQDWLMPFVNHPVLTLLIAAGVTAVAALAMAQVRYDYNLLNMMPRDLDSVRWIEELDESGLPIWDAVIMAQNLEEARELTGRLRELETVERVGGVGWLFPADAQPKETLGVRARQRLGPQVLRTEAVTDVSPVPKDTPAILGQQLKALRFAVGIAIDREDVQESPRVLSALRSLAEQIDQTAEAFDAADGDPLEERVAELQEAFRENVRAIRRQIDLATADRPLTLEDLPEYLRREAYVTADGRSRYVLKVYPKQDVWDPQKLGEFIEELRAEVGEENVIGSPVQIYESGRLMEASYREAGFWAVLVVLALVFLDFFRPLDAVLSLLPVALGFVTTFGAMWLAGFSINPANLMVLPLMFGIGVASGVHMLHRYQQAPFRRPLGLSEGTGKAIILTSLTTIIAFSAMLTAEHRGIRSLGFVLAVGISMTLIACLTVMPAVLELRNRYHAWRRGRQWNRDEK